jgi:hypothetical protein
MPVTLHWECTIIERTMLSKDSIAVSGQDSNSGPILEQARKYNKFSHKKATFTLVNVEMQFFTSG